MMIKSIGKFNPFASWTDKHAFIFE